MATVAREQRNSATGEDTTLDDLLQKQTVNREMMLLKVENETIMAECRMHPRDMAAIKDRLCDLLHNFPEFAEDAIYSKKVGTEEVNGKWVDKYAEDLSIRAAEALAEAYGFNRIRADVSPVDENSVKIEATFTDFQSGRIWQDGTIVSKFYTASKSKGGGRVKHDDARFYDTVAKAAKSKVIREVICRSVNPALKAWFKNECYKVMENSLKTDEVDKIVGAWKGLGADLEQLETIVGKPLAMGWLVSDQLRLRTLYVAVRDGEESVQSLLSAKAKPEEPSKETIDAELAAKAAAKKAPKISGLTGVKDEMCQANDSGEVSKIARIARDTRTLSENDLNLLQEMEDSHKERCRSGARGDAHEG